MTITLHLHCSLCDAKIENDLEDLGWAVRSSAIEDETALCPRHSAVEEFFKSQCVGCVEGWPDCGLYRSFSYSRKRDITEQELEIIRAGICPRRTNGTRMISNQPEGVTMKSLDLSRPASEDSGRLLAEGIQEYCERWPSDD